MRSDKPFVAMVMASMLTAEMVFSGVAAQSAAQPQIVYQAPNLANRQTVQDMLSALLADGFTYIEVHRTFLGRARFAAYTTTEKREVVINPTSGEVLRDLAQENTGGLPAQANANAQANSNNGNGNNGNGNNGNNGNGNNGNNGNGNGNNGGGNGNGNNGNGKGNGGN